MQCGNVDPIFDADLENFCEENNIKLLTKVPILREIAEKSAEGKLTDLQKTAVAECFRVIADSVATFVT